MSGNSIHAEAVDPVCKMKVDPNHATQSLQYNGRTYFFCAAACRRAFEGRPQKYLKNSPATQHKGFWRKYLERLNRATGGKPPSCCH